jgi:hypothetical protein
MEAQYPKQKECIASLLLMKVGWLGYRCSYSMIVLCMAGWLAAVG